MKDFNLTIDKEKFTGQEVMSLISNMSVMFFDKKLVGITNAVEMAKKVKELGYYSSDNDAQNFLDFAMVTVDHIKFSKMLEQKRNR